MDLWPSANLGSGGQVSANRFDGSTGMLNLHGPALYDLPWEARYGEVYEKALYDADAALSRRIGHHYIAFEGKYPSSSYQPEGWQSPDGSFAVMKTHWGWYKVDLSGQRLSSQQVNDYLDNPSPPTYLLTVEGGWGSGEIVEGVIRPIRANDPDQGMEFDKWTGDVAYIDDVNATEAMLTMPDKDLTLTASYKAAELFTLSLSIEGTGSVITNPSGGSYVMGTAVALIPMGSGGTSFIRWEGDLAGMQNPAVVIMDSSIQVTAIFSDAATGFGEALTRMPVFHLAGTSGTQELNFRVCLPFPSDVILEIYDMTGCLLASIKQADMPLDSRIIPFKRDAAMVPGLYIARLSYGPRSETLKFILH